MVRAIFLVYELPEYLDQIRSSIGKLKKEEGLVQIDKPSYRSS